MRRGSIVAVLTAAALLVAAPAALACKMSAWLAHGPVGGPGQPLEITGGGFDPGMVELTWGGEGETLAEVEVGADGTLAVDVELPADAAGRTPVVAHADHAEAEASPAHPAAWVDVVLPGGEAPSAAKGSNDGQAVDAPVVISALALAALVGLAVGRRLLRGSRVGDHVDDDRVDVELQALIEQETVRSGD